MEFLMNLVGQCGIFSSFTYHTEEIISNGSKRLYIRIKPADYIEVNWRSAKCIIEEGKVSVLYEDDKIEVPFDKQFDYAQSFTSIDGTQLVIVIPSKVRVMELSIGNFDITERNND